MSNPEFNNARGSASSLQFTPPFSFSDMTVSVFPLRADMTQLQSFIDGYLNLDSDNVRFEAILPYVYLQVLDYGKMSIEAANMGWVSQVEVAFCVPLRWMVKRDGEWVFHDWAANCPFIFVDNELSMTTGREVYGWPKVLAHIDPSISQWVSDPHGCQRVFDIQLPSRGQSESESANSTFLSVHKSSSPNFLDTPLNLQSALDPVTYMPTMGLNLAKTGIDMYRTLGSMAAEGLGNLNASSQPFGKDWLSGLSKLGQAANWNDPKSWSTAGQKMISTLFPKMYMNTVNLKQFRDASVPSTACYQALTNSKMIFRRLNGGGPLGQQNLAFGQIDGGYRIDISQLSQQPVIDSLGLLVDETRNTETGPVASLRPVLPFWLKVDMDYSRGRTITWRSQSSDWLYGQNLKRILKGEDVDDTEAEDNRSVDPDLPDNEQPLADSADVPKRPRVKTRRPEFQAGENSFNTARGAAIQELSGPFLLPDTTVRVLPLLADEEKLKTFGRDYLDVKGHSRFEAWGTYAYLVAYNYTKRISEESGQTLFASREVNFVVPVKQYDWYEDDDYDLSTPEGRAKRDEEKLVSAAMVAPFSYVDDASVAISSTEVHGVPTLRSEVGSPPHTWMNTSGPEAGQHLLVTSTLVLPELGVDAGASHEVLLNVSTDPVLSSNDKLGWGQIARKWGAERVADLKRKYEERGVRYEQKSQSDSFRHLRALALEVMTGKLSLNSVTLKQFRDAWEPNKACYQALVQGRKTIDRLHEVHEINEQLNVWISRYPTQPISEILGLKVKHTDLDNNREVFEAIRPFWFRADITEHLGQTLFERIADNHWTEQDTPEQIAGWLSVKDADMRTALKDENAQVRYFRTGFGPWPEELLAINSIDESKRETWIKELVSSEAKGEISNLQIYSRKRTRPIMAHFPTLNHVDRVHVNDLTGFLEDKQNDPESNVDLAVDTLGKFMGQVSPATILDSILSRQWGRPEADRDGSPCADFVVHVESLGPIVDDQIFLRHERRGEYWPQSADDCLDTENKRKGFAWQLWDDVWTLVRQGDHEGYSVTRKPEDPETYLAKATQCLPDWFGPELKTKPSDWNSEEWKEISQGLGELVGWSHYKVDWNRIIRNLSSWQGIAMQMSEQLGVKCKPDTAGEGQAPNVADVLNTRLRGLN